MREQGPQCPLQILLQLPRVRIHKARNSGAPRSADHLFLHWRLTVPDGCRRRLQSGLLARPTNEQLSVHRSFAVPAEMRRDRSTSAFPVFHGRFEKMVAGKIYWVSDGFLIILQLFTVVMPITHNGLAQKQRKRTKQKPPAKDHCCGKSVSSHPP